MKKKNTFASLIAFLIGLFNGCVLASIILIIAWHTDREEMIKMLDDAEKTSYGHC